MHLIPHTIIPTGDGGVEVGMTICTDTTFTTIIEITQMFLTTVVEGAAHPT